MQEIPGSQLIFYEQDKKIMEYSSFLMYDWNRCMTKLKQVYDKIVLIIIITTLSPEILKQRK